MDGNNITSIIESRKMLEGDKHWVVDGDGRKGACGQFFFAFFFFLFLANYVGCMVMVIYGFNGIQCLELSNYFSLLVCVNGLCIVVWRTWIMESMKQTLYEKFLGILKKPQVPFQVVVVFGPWSLFGTT